MKKLNIDWTGLVKALLKAALPFFIGATTGLIAGCSFNGTGLGWTLQ